MCVEHANFSLLKSLLKFNEAEAALLKLSCAIAVERSALEDFCEENLENCTLFGRQYWRFSQDRIIRLAEVFGLSTNKVSSLFGTPNTLVALHLLDGQAWRKARSVADLATASEKLITLLSTDYMSHEALLADLVVQPFDWPAFPDPDITDIGYYEDLPPEVAAVCVASNASLPLTSPQLVSAIWWQTCWRPPLEAVQPLDRRLELEAVSKAVSSAVVACRRANRMPADFDILKAIYTAA